MGLSTTYTKAETDYLLQQIDKKVVEGYKGDLRILDPAPTEIGYYILLDVGTYTNLGGIVVSNNNLNFASLDGTTWSKVEVAMPNPDYSDVLNPNSTDKAETGKSIVDFFLSRKNKFDKEKIISNKYIGTDGNLYDIVGGAVSEWIPVTPKSILTLEGRLNSDAKSIRFRKENGDIRPPINTNGADIGFLDAPLNGTIYVPYDATEMQMTVAFYNESIDNVKLIGNVANNETYVPLFTDNPLVGKTAIYNGDSICNAIYDVADGWAGRIAVNNSMTYKNYAVDGATIAAETYAGGNPRHWICRSVDLMISEFPNADYVIIEGGTNDADLLSSARIGAISNDYETFDDTTFYGALESSFRKLVLQYSDKKIGFIIAHKMGNMANGEWENSLRRQFFDIAIEVCKKWGISYLDLWYEVPLIYNVDLNTRFYVDGQHLTSDGYNLISPKIEKWMKSL